MKDFLNNEIKVGSYILIFDGNDGRYTRLGIVVGFAKTKVRYIDGSRKMVEKNKRYVFEDTCEVKIKSPEYVCQVESSTTGNYDKKEGLLLAEKQWKEIASKLTDGKDTKSVTKSDIQI